VFKSPGGYLCEIGILLLALSCYTLLVQDALGRIRGILEGIQGTLGRIQGTLGRFQDGQERFQDKIGHGQDI
jgi:hypothetical protein